MTNEEFDKIISIKKEIDCLERILYDYFGTSKNPKIQKLLILYKMFGDIDISISKEISDTILKIIEEKSEKI